jgi:CBS-domain-containing membrane protein
MTAANVMTKEVITLGPDSTMLDALRIIKGKEVRQIPVIDRTGRLEGVVTPRKLFKGILPPYVAEGMLEDLRFAPELPEFVENIKKLAKKGVEDVLEKDFVAVTPETSTMEVATLFFNPAKHTEAILVLGPDKKLLGIISPWDVFRRILEHYNGL